MNKRITNLDISRGIAILLVILGHSCIPKLCAENMAVYSLYLIINAINMPIFFVISGYMYAAKKDNPSLPSYVLKKVKSLILPYVIYSLLVYLIILAAGRIGYLPGQQLNFTNLARGLLFFDENTDKHLWFLPVLFIVSIVRYFFGKNTGNVHRAVTLAISVAAIILNTFNIIDGMLFKPMYYLFFYELGMFVFNKREVFYNKKPSAAPVSVILLGFISVYLLCFFGANNQVFMLMVTAVIKMIIGVLSSLLFLLLGIKLNNKRLSKKLANIGADSFYYYLFHQPFITAGTAMAVYYLSGWVSASILMGCFMGVACPGLIIFAVRKIKGLHNSVV